MPTKIFETASAANDIISTANNGPFGGFRNMIINGNFDFWQRGTSLSAGTGGRYLADRWATGSVGTTHTASRQSFTLGQTEVPNEPTYYHRNVVSSVAGAGNYCILIQHIENVRTFAGQTITASFYAKADASKPMSVELYQHFGTGGSPSTAVTGIGATKFNLTTSWQKFTLTTAIPSISGKVLGTSNNDSLIFHFWFDAGSTFNARTSTLGQQSGTFDISQVQIEPGLISTPFEIRPLAQELKLCQRYYEKSYNVDVNPGTNTADGIISKYANQMSNITHTGLCNFRFQAQKRAVPSMSYYSLTGVFNTLYESVNNLNITIAGQTASTSGGVVFINQTSATTAIDVIGHFVADAEL